MSAERAFMMSSGMYSAAEMLAANADDETFCEWVRDAQPGDVFPGGGEACECVTFEC